MTRRIYYYFIAIVLGLIVMTDPTLALRCGTNLIKTGDHRFDVLRKCGEPLSREHVGYTITADNKRELIIEEWVYGPENGFYNILIFEGGTLVEIKSIRE